MTPERFREAHRPQLGWIVELIIALVITGQWDWRTADYVALELKRHRFT